MSVKVGHMADLKLKQLQYESDALKRILGFIKEENVYLKNRLSAILKDRFDGNLLETLDSFQNRFVKTDELIVLLRNDVSELDSLLVREAGGNSEIINNIGRKFVKMRTNVNIAEREFGKLKTDFHKYLAENL